MNRVLKLPLGLTVERMSYQLVITIDLKDVSIAEWCLNLCLLKFELVDTLVFLLGKRKLKIEVGAIAESRSANVSLAPNEVHIRVSPTELDCWLDFFLKYYRDGFAQVRHIDVEALLIGDHPEDIYVTFTVKDFAPPISAEEARRILDSYD